MDRVNVNILFIVLEDIEETCCEIPNVPIVQVASAFPAECVIIIQYLAAVRTIPHIYRLLNHQRALKGQSKYYASQQVRYHEYQLLDY